MSGSRPDVGSSMTTSGGTLMAARAISTRRCWPNDSSRKAAPGAEAQLQPGEPGLRPRAIARLGLLVHADAVEEAAQQDLFHAAADAVVAMQARGDDADVLLDVPHRLAAAAPPAEQMQVVAVGLRVIAGDHLEQRRFAGPIRPLDERVLSGQDAEVEPLEDDLLPVA